MISGSENRSDHFSNLANRQNPKGVRGSDTLIGRIALSRIHLWGLLVEWLQQLGMTDHGGRLGVESRTGQRMGRTAGHYFHARLPAQRARQVRESSCEL